MPPTPRPTILSVLVRRKHPLDVLAAAASSIAALAALAAAGFSSWQASIAHDTEVRQLRAYLTAQPFELDGLSPSGAGDRIRVKLRIANKGQTPATGVYAGCRYSIASYPPPAQRPSPLPTPTGDISKFAVFSGETVFVCPVSQVFPTDQLTLLFKNKSDHDALYLDVDIHYIDVFDNKRSTTLTRALVGSMVQHNDAGAVTGLEWVSTIAPDQID